VRHTAVLVRFIFEVSLFGLALVARFTRYSRRGRRTSTPKRELRDQSAEPM
jgi:hypothetical protein